MCDQFLGAIGRGFIGMTFAASIACADVGLIEVSPERAAEFRDRLHVAVGEVQRKPHQQSVHVSGPVTDGVVVSVILIVVEGTVDRLRVPVSVVERTKMQRDDGEPQSNKEWSATIQLDRELAANATIDVLLDMPDRDVGDVYRVTVKDFLPTDPGPDKTQSP
jgi:hypothetical protein